MGALRGMEKGTGGETTVGRKVGGLTKRGGGAQALATRFSKREGGLGKEMEKRGVIIRGRTLKWEVKQWQLVKAPSEYWTCIGGKTSWGGKKLRERDKEGKKEEENIFVRNEEIEDST